MKVKVTLSGTYEIAEDTMEEFYGTTDPVEAMEIDKANFEDDPGHILMVSDDTSVTVEQVD